MTMTEPKPTMTATEVQTERAEAERPFAVVLEHGLCRTDPAQEARVQAFCADPLGYLKGVRPPTPPPEALPLDPAVLAQLREARAQGRETVLVTRGAAAQAEAIAEALGLFDRVETAAPGPDLAARLEAVLGAWPELAQASAPAAGRLRARLKAIRPHQWAKNMLVFLPALAAHEAAGFWAAMSAFIAFSLTASSVYVLNDISDLAADRAHPRKRLRPFAAGTLSIGEGLWLASGLILVAIAVSVLLVAPAFLAVLAVYYLATFAYSFWLKRKLVIDVIMLAALYTLRIVAGAVASAVLLSPWMLGFSMFIFLALAAVKRQAELTDMVLAGDSGRVGRGYVPDDLPVIRSMALAAGYSAVLVLALYISSEDVRTLYSTPEALWLLCPILLYWISRMVMNTHRGKMTDDPIVYAATDRVSLSCIFSSALVVAAAAVF
ncbi:MAG: UbiA family prenyltransferase [Pseudomonadota bacterium]